MTHTPPRKTLISTKHATADKRTHVHSTETASNHRSFTKPPSHAEKMTLQKHTSDLQKTNSRQDTEITPHLSVTQNTETPQNSVNTSGP